MRIQLVSGAGSAPTQLAAFDAALVDAGISNYNLITLSSVIPAGAEIIETDEKPQLSGSWGDRLYQVMAAAEAAALNAEAWAGVGWVVNEETGQGLFVEHHGHSRDEVERDITSSLAAMVSRRAVAFGDVHMRIHGIRCEGDPVCALVSAVYESVPWENADESASVSANEDTNWTRADEAALALVSE
jgi:arginine decarboxylase